MNTNELARLTLALYPDDMPPLHSFSVIRTRYAIQVTLTVECADNVWTGHRMFDLVDMSHSRVAPEYMVRHFLKQFRDGYIEGGPA